MTKASVTPFRTNFNATMPFSDTGAKFWLGAGVELTYTVPGESDQKFRAEFRYNENADVWVKLNGTIIVPVAGTVVDSYNEEFRPEFKVVNGGDVLHFISTGTPQFGVVLFSLPG